MASNVWSIELTTQYIQEHHLVLHYDEDRLVDLWTPAPSVAVPIRLRRSVVKHRVQLHRWMREARIEVCVSPTLHKRFWQQAGPDRTTCLMCQQLDVDRSYVVEEGKFA